MNSLVFVSDSWIIGPPCQYFVLTQAFFFHLWKWSLYVNWAVSDFAPWSFLFFPQKVWGKKWYFFSLSGRLFFPLSACICLSVVCLPACQCICHPKIRSFPFNILSHSFILIYSLISILLFTFKRSFFFSFAFISNNWFFPFIHWFI